MDSTKIKSNSGGSGSVEPCVGDGNDAAAENRLVLYFVKTGQDLPQYRINVLVERARKFGAIVLGEFKAPATRKSKRRRLWAYSTLAQQQQQPLLESSSETTCTSNDCILPTHLVIGEDGQPVKVAEALNFSSVEKLERFLRAKNIKCAVPKWVSDSDGKLDNYLRFDERWWKIDWFSKKRPASVEAEIESQGNAAKLSQSPASKRNRAVYQSDDEEDYSDEPNNRALADAIRELGKLYQKCPVQEFDMWRSYTYDKAAGRIRNLDFEVTLDKECQQKLKSMNGIAAKTIEKINQFLVLGRIPRTDALRNDPQRIAMKELMGIWGVGQSKAKDLWIQGYATIQDVRRGLDTNKLQLDRNACIGVECYEDFLEEMSRKEVEAIGKIIEDTVRREFPPADQEKLEINIMGSYRRKKESCGDVDVLITHQDYVETAPPEVLGEVVDKLLDSGNMAYHLTLIAGMTVRSKDDFHEGGFNKVDGFKEKASKNESSSYMGVFNSPMVPGRRRRVDIKIYPYRERVFAFLYFTGNGFFNRSMRLYVARQKGFHLNDHGLFTDKGKGQKRVMEANSERDVFEYLGLEYKEPHERDCFDALVTDDEMSDGARSAFLGDEMIHRWID